MIVTQFFKSYTQNSQLSTIFELTAVNNQEKRWINMWI